MKPFLRYFRFWPAYDFYRQYQNLQHALAIGNVDGRQAIDGLSAMVSGVMRLGVFIKLKHIFF